MALGILAFFLFLTLMVAIVAAGFYAWHLWKLWQERRRHTRERFLFDAITLFARLFIAYTAFAFGGAWPVRLLVAWSSDQHLEFHLAPTPPDATATIGATAILICYLLVTWKIFRDWQGATSEYQRKYGPQSIFDTALKAATDRDRRRLMRHPARDDNDEFADSAPKWALPGHLRALTLILAYDERYHITPANWHEEEQAFIGRYGIEEEPFIFFHSRTMNQEFLNHVHRTRGRYPRHRTRLIVEEKPEFYDETLIGDVGILTYDEVLFSNRFLLNYQRALIEELQVKRFGDNAPSVEDMLVRLHGITQPDKAVVSDVTQFILDWVGGDKYNEHIAILGEYGQGKSILSISLCIELVRTIDKFKRVPMLIQLGGKSPRNTSADAIVDAWAGQYRINPSLARAWIETGHAVLIFDAFDEMDLVGDRTLRLRNFMRIWEFAERPAPRLIITGRPNLFLDTDEMQLALKLSARGTAGHYARAVYLSKLDRGQIKTALRNWLPKTRAGILAAYDRAHGSGSFADLIARPSILALAASVWPTIELQAENAAIGNTTIIREFLYQTYVRQREKRNRSGHHPFLNIKELSFFMRAFAVTMRAQAEATNRISRRDVLPTVESILNEWPTEIARFGHLPSDDTSDRGGMDLAEWVRSAPDRLSAVSAEVAATGVLVEDTADPSQLKMAHKSFFEYLYAEAYVCCELPESVGARSESITLNALARRPILEARLLHDILIFAAELVFFLNVQNRLHERADRWRYRAKRWLHLKLMFVSGLIAAGGFVILCINLISSMISWWFDIAPQNLSFILSIPSFLSSFLCMTLGMTGMLAAAYQKPSVNNALCVNFLCALLYEESLACITKEVPFEALIDILDGDFTVVEFGSRRRTFSHKYLDGIQLKEIAKFLALKGHHIVPTTVFFPLNLRMSFESSAFYRIHTKALRMLFNTVIGQNQFGVRRPILYDVSPTPNGISVSNLVRSGIGFNIMRTFIIIRKKNSISGFVKMSEVHAGLRVGELGFYFARHFGQIGPDEQYGILWQFSIASE